MSGQVKSWAREAVLLVIGGLVSSLFTWVGLGVTGGFELRSQVLILQQSVKGLDDALQHHLQHDSVHRKEFEDLQREVQLLRSSTVTHAQVALLQQTILARLDRLESRR